METQEKYHWDLSDCGISSPSYFQGVGTAHTPWDMVFVGVGNTLRDAAEDAMEQACSVMDDSVTQRAIATISDEEIVDSLGSSVDETVGAALGNEEDEDNEEDNCGEENQYYVALFVSEAGVTDEDFMMRRVHA